MSENKKIMDEITTLRLLHILRHQMQRFSCGDESPSLLGSLVRAYGVFGDGVQAAEIARNLIKDQVADFSFNPYAYKTTTAQEDKALKKAVKKSSEQNKQASVFQKQIMQEIAYQHSQGKMSDVPDEPDLVSISVDENNFKVFIAQREEPVLFRLRSRGNKYFSFLGVKACSDPRFAKQGFDNSTYKKLLDFGEKGFVFEKEEPVANAGKKYTPSRYKTYLGLSSAEELNERQKKELDILNSLSATDQLHFIGDVQKRTQENKKHKRFFEALEAEKNPLLLLADQNALKNLFEQNGLPDASQKVQKEFVTNVVQTDKTNIWNNFTKSNSENSRFSYYEILTSNLISAHNDIFRDILDIKNPQEAKAKIKSAFRDIKELSYPLLPDALAGEILTLGIFQQGVLRQPTPQNLKNMNLLLNEFGLNIKFVNQKVVKAPDDSIESGMQQMKISRNAFEEDKKTPLCRLQEKEFHKKLSSLGIQETDAATIHHFLALKYDAFVEPNLNSSSNYVRTARQHPWNIDGHDLVHAFDTAGEFLVSDENNKLKLMDFNHLRKAFKSGENLTLQIPILQKQNKETKEFCDLLPCEKNNLKANFYVSYDGNAGDIFSIPPYCKETPTKGSNSLEK